MIEAGWIMDSECCCRCGALLDYFETDLCTDCLRDAWYEEDQERLNDIFWEEDEEPTIGTPEEAHAVALSLSDAEIERLEDEDISN